MPGASLLVCSGVLIALARIEDRTWLTLLLVPVVFAGLHRSRNASRPARTVFLMFLIVATAVVCVDLVAEIRGNIREPQEWDFLGFWLHAHTAVDGHNFYDPQQAAALASPFSVSSEFRKEIIDTGFWYPPPSMFLFLPLGWFDLRTAQALWYVMHAGILAFDVLLLWRIFFPRGSAIELAACATLASIAHGTLLTLQFSQTSFAALLALLLFWRRRRTGAAGLWVAVGIFVKPFLAVLGLSLLAGARWRALAALAASAAALTLAAFVVFGPRTFADYVAGDEAHAKPGWIYSQDTNQSVLGLVLRASGTRCAGTGCVTNPFYLAAAAALAAITLPLGLKLAPDHDEWTAALFLLLALLVYPVSQSFYSVLLMPLLLLAWRYRDRVLGGAWTMTALATIVYVLCVFGDGNTTVAAFAVLWAAMTIIGIRLVQGRGWPLRSTTAAAPLVAS